MRGKYKQLDSVSMRGIEACLSPDLQKLPPEVKLKKHTWTKACQGLVGKPIQE